MSKSSGPVARPFVLVVVLFPILCRALCSCDDPIFCHPLKVQHEKEIFAFQVNKTNWRTYNWTALTTVVLFNGLDNEMLCHAHSNNVRVVWGASYSPDQLSNVTARKLFTESWVAKVKETSTDGVNIDTESPIPKDSPNRELLVLLMKELRGNLSSAVPGSQTTFDVAWSPDCIDGRCYDFKGLADNSDFLFVMDYDMESQIWPPRPCIAAANSPLPWIPTAMQAFMKLGIDPSKLVLGIPWYGYIYPCQNLTVANGTSEVCPLKPVPFRGCPCSDAAGSEHSFANIQAIFSNSSITKPTGVRWNDEYQAPWFNYLSPGEPTEVWQVWFDNVRSLSLKFKLAKTMSLRGVGMWNADLLGGSHQFDYMWEAFSVFLE